MALPAALHIGRMVAPTILRPVACTRAAMVRMASTTWASGAGGALSPPPMSFVPSRSRTYRTPGRESTSRSSRCGAGGPQHWPVGSYGFGWTLTVLPLIPALATDNRRPGGRVAMRAASTSVQRGPPPNAL